MQKKFKIQFMCFLLAILLIIPITLSGCSKPRDKDAPEITIDYLYNGYVDQLLSDGAEKVIGSIELSKDENEEIIVTVHPKELVTDEKEESGYRVVSYAANRELILPSHSYCTFISNSEDDNTPELLSTGDFFTAVNENYEKNGEFSEYGDFILYDIYVLDDQALLILARNVA